MVLPKSLYESLPYLYIASALGVVVLVDSALVYLFAAVLYAGGAMVWVMRSAYRRKTSPNVVKNRHGFVMFPAVIYEYLPFIYLAAGVLVLTQVSLPWSAVPGGLLCMAGGLVWSIRAIYRNQEHYDVAA
ncbi:MAG TPA: hypothetical protein VIS52_05925 [Motiliproteus sp.]